MGKFEQMFAMFKKEMCESASRQDQKFKESAERRTEEMRDVFEQPLDEIQQTMLKFQEYYQRRFYQASEITKKNEEQMNLIERNALRTERHLEVTVAQAAQRIEDSFDQKFEDNLTLQQCHVEERLQRFGNEINGSVDLQTRGLSSKIKELAE